MKDFVERNEPKIQRLLEIFPGFTVWMIILFPFWASLFWPTLVAYTVLIFMGFWAYRSLTLGIYSIQGFLKIKEYKNTNWQKYYQLIQKQVPYQWEEITHVVLIPNYNESANVLRRSLSALAAQEIARRQLYVVLAMEERAQDSREKAELLIKEYQHHFKKMWAEYHPDNIVGEVKGKAANERWAAIKVKEKLVDNQGLDIKKITLSTCDADARFHPKYFSALTVKFLANPNRYRRFWQPIILEHNNIERVPALVRVVSILGGSFHLFDAQEPRKLAINYSTYSTSLKLLEEIDYWDPDIIPEDWHIFLKSFFSVNGEVEVEPIYLPTTIDAAEAKTYLGSLVNRYEQCTRHAWGVTLVPYVIIQFFKHPEINLGIRSLRVFKVIESQLLWSTSWFFVTLAATIPPLINPAFEQTVLGQNLPRFAGHILTFSLFTLLITIFIDTQLRPPNVTKKPLWQKPLVYLQWFLLPIATLFMAALPGLHSQTRLMFGKYMEYKVAEKV